MPVVVSPGVYVQERDDSLYSPSIGPTTVGIVATATKGPINQAVLVTSEGQLTEIFGRPRTKDLGMHAAIEALKAIRIVYFVRIAGASTDQGLISVNDAGSGPTAASIGPSANSEPFNLLGANSVELPAGTRTATIRITYDNGAGLQSNQDATIVATQAEVTSGNPETYDLSTVAGGANPVSMRVAVDGGPLQVITFNPGDASNYAAVTAAEVVSVVNLQLEGGGAREDTGDVIIFSDKYGTASLIQIQAPASGPSLNDATNGLNMSTTAVAGTGDAANLGSITGAEVKAAIEADEPDLTVTVGVGGEITISTDNTGATTSIFLVTASGPNTIVGAGVGQINLTPIDTTVLGTSSTAAAPTIRFQAKTNGSHSSRIKVRVSNSTAISTSKKVEVLLDNVVAEVYDLLFKGSSPPAGTFDMVDAINDGTPLGEFLASELIEAVDLNVNGANPANSTYTLSTGDDGDDWTSGTVIGTVTGSVRTGMQIFGDVDQIFVNVLATPGISYAAVISEGINICSTRADCIFIADAPSDLSPEDVIKWHNGDNSITATIDQEDRTEANSTTFNSSYAALYYPFLTIFDKFNDQNISVPPSAVVLRTFGYTDQVADPWFAPAGTNRTQAQSVLDLAFNAGQGERDVMQLPGNNVNAIASIAGVGVVIMGQKTLQRAPTALDRVNVRRLLLAIEKVIAQTVFFLIFEPNDPTMWRRFVNLVDPFMRDIKSRRGLFDFKVVADSSTTTPVLIDQNTFLGKIFLQPTKAAEKLIVSFNITPTATDFSEFSSQ